MSHNITFINTNDKAQCYANIIPQIKAVVSVETDWMAIWAHTVAMLKQAFSFFWVGFYRVANGQLNITTYQGPLCCSNIQFGKGVCGTAWKQAQTLVVPNVNQFPGHIACSSLSQSEIVVPIIYQNKIIAVLDIDSEQLNTFDQTDRQYLEELAQFLATLPLPAIQ